VRQLLTMRRTLHPILVVVGPGRTGDEHVSAGGAPLGTAAESLTPDTESLIASGLRVHNGPTHGVAHVRVVGKREIDLKDVIASR
jgi:hypothetical protein